MPLSDVACRNAKAGSKPVKMSDGGGLYLMVTPSGSKLWRMNYRFEGKQKTLAFGAYPLVALSRARALRDEAKGALLEGRDPAVREAESVKHSFGEVANEWLAAQDEVWASAHSQRVASRMRADVLPQIGKLEISSITPSTMLAVFRKIEERGALEIAKRMRQTTSQIFRYAIATERATTDPTRDLQDALKPSPRVRHMAKLRADELEDFFAKLAVYDGDKRTSAAIEFIMHTFVRTKELSEAQWSEIEGDVWRIPAERMKMRREHLVPLTDQSKAILDRLRDQSNGSRFIAPMSQNTMIFAMYRMGYHSRATIHGMRGLASTVLNESGLWSVDAVEMQLAHVQGGVRGAYNSALYLPERRRMMAWWSEFLASKATPRSRT